MEIYQHGQEENIEDEKQEETLDVEENEELEEAYGK